jgi:hypothetical protein
MNEMSERSKLPTVESCARRDTRWSTVDVFAESALSLLACAMVALFLSTSLLFAAPAALEGQGPHSDHRAKPIVNGRPVQPRQSDLRTPDVSTRDAEDVERLYRELMELTAPDTLRNVDGATERQGLAKKP